MTRTVSVHHIKRGCTAYSRWQPGLALLVIEVFAEIVPPPREHKSCNQNWS